MGTDKKLFDFGCEGSKVNSFLTVPTDQLRILKFSKKIISTNGYAILIDIDDYQRVNKFSWSSSLMGINLRYAITRLRFGKINGKEIQKKVYLHRFILGLFDPKIKVDHVNCDGLDNRKINLRITDQRHNMMNRRKLSILTSRYKGVSWNKHRSRWKAAISVEGKQKTLGLFKNEKDAASAYNEAAVKYFATFARTNRLAAGELPGAAGAVNLED